MAETMTIDQAMALAVGHHQAGRLAEAETIYRTVLGADPAHPLANHNLAQIALTVGRPDIAHGLAQAAVAASPAMAAFHNTLGEALRIQARHAEALVAFDQAIALAPDDPFPHGNRGIALASLQRWAEAELSFRQAIALKPDLINAHANLGGGLFQNGLPSEALVAFQSAIALDASHIEARLGAIRALIALGRAADAVDQAESLRPMESQPGFPAVRLAILFIEAGRSDIGRAVLADQIARDPCDAFGARAMLAHLDRATTAPDRAPDAQIDRFYAGKAMVWDNGAGYRAAELVADVLRASLTPTSDVLDVGCGTGLVGARLAGCGRLVGVDLSHEMLKKALAKGVYAELLQSELTGFLRSRPDAFDAIACAATLIHFSDLSAPFHATAGALRPGGLFALTLFPLDAQPEGFALNPVLDLAQNGIFAHGRAYVAATARKVGLEVVTIRDEVHEHHEGRPVTGLLVVLRKPVRTAADEQPI